MVPAAGLAAGSFQDHPELLTYNLKVVSSIMNSREVIRQLEADGWQLRKVKGSHHHFTHPTKGGKVTVKHPAKDFPIGTLKSMEKQAGIKFT